MVFLDRYNWPIERIKGRPITNLIRLLLHARRIVRGSWDGYGLRPWLEAIDDEGGG